MSKKSLFRGCFEKQYGKLVKTLLKPASKNLSYSLITAKSIELKKSLLLTCKILGLLVNTLACDKKYPVLNRDNLTMPIQMELSQKQKKFSRFFAAFLKSSWNFERSEKKMSLKAFAFPKMRTRKTWLDKKSGLRGPFEKQHDKRAQALFKYASHHLYDNHWWLPSQLSWKKSLLFTCKILGLLVNTLGAMKSVLFLIETI